MTAYSSKGWAITQDVETALGTGAGTPKNIRVNAAPTMPSAVKLGVDNPNIGRAHPHDKADKPVYYEGVREDGLSFEAYLRRDVDGSSEAPLVTWLRSAGAVVQYGTDTLCDTGCTTSSIVLDDDLNAGGGVTSGQGLATVIEDSSGGLWHPTLFAAYTSGTKTGIATMDLPNAPADGDDALTCYTITPGSQQVPTTNTLTFEAETRGYYDGGNDRSKKMTGCVLNSLGTTVIEPNTPVSFSPSFHVADVSDSNTEIAVEDFQDDSKFSIPDCNFHCGFATATGATGDITRASLQLLRAEIDWGISTTPIPTAGGDNCVNAVQGYMAACNDPTVTITVLADANTKTNFLDLLTTTGNTSRYLHFVQPSTVETGATSKGLAWGFWFPNIHLAAEDAITEELFGDSGYQTITVKFVCSTSDFDSAALNINSSERAPWYIGIGA